MKLVFEENKKIQIVKSVTASHIVDAQKGFTKLCPNELPVPDGELIVKEIKEQNKLVKYKTLSKDVHPSNAIWIADKKNPQLSSIDGKNVDVFWNAHCISGTYGMELLNGIGHITDYDFFVAKGFEPDLHPYTSVYHDLKKKISTGLIEWYNQHDISTVIIGGLALNSEKTPLCVGETVIDLSNAGFQVILNLAATKSLGSELGRIHFVDTLINKYNILIINSCKELEII